MAKSGLISSTGRSNSGIIGHGKYKGMTREDAKAALKKDMLRKREADNELVRGRFRNLEQRGMTQKFSIKFYPGEPVEKYELEDGEMYEIPKKLVKHLNKGCYFIKYKENNMQVPGLEDVRITGAMHDGRIKAEQMWIKEKIHRFAFVPLSFMADDDADYGPEIVEVVKR